VFVFDELSAGYSNAASCRRRRQVVLALRMRRTDPPAFGEPFALPLPAVLLALNMRMRYPELRLLRWQSWPTKSQGFLAKPGKVTRTAEQESLCFVTAVDWQ